MTKADILGKCYRLKVNSTYITTRRNGFMDKFFEAGTVFVVKDSRWSDRDDVRMQTVIDGELFEFGYCASSILNHTEKWEEVK